MGCLSEGRSGELQICQPDLDAGENHRADNFVKVRSLLHKKLAGWPDPKAGGEWCCIQLASGH